MTSSAVIRSGIDVLIVGRANVDLTVRVPHRAGPSQTVFGSPLVVTPGGKSLNQAVAVVRLGGHAQLVANAGDDQWGRLLRTKLQAAGVDLPHFHLLPGVPTGAAVIEVTPDGENYPVLALSPAAEVTSDQVGQALAQTSAPVMTVQLDMPPEPVATALTKTPPRAPTRIGTLVPHQDLDYDLLHQLHVYVVNQHEAATIIGTADVDPLASATQLRQLGPASVVVTAGADGAAYSSREGTAMIGAAPAPTVDSTGAGDAFLGCLALDLSRGASLRDAVAHAVQVGTLAIQHTGAHLPAP